ncbi:MAG: hypothetical protein NTY35_17885 [Planctomycetota bacterium]|nr:hypothetical protein [Planctomycetota bacterium]
MPRWETLSGPTFPLEVGATGAWGPTWTPVVHPLGPALAYLDVLGRRIDVEPDVRIRTDPVAAVTP